MFKKQLASSELAVGRWLSVGCAAAFVALAAVGCGDDQKGTDINVPAPTAGRSGNGSQSGGSSSTAGKSSGGAPSEGGASEAGASEGGASGTVSGGGTGGSGGKGGNGAGGISNGGSAGMGGTAGSANGGSAGTSGAGGHSGSAGNGGSTGGGGLGGTGGSGGAAGGGGGGGTSGAGSGGGTGTCGNGIVEGTEQCDGGGPTPICSDNCETVTTQACWDCEKAGSCEFSSDNCKGPANPPWTAEQQSVCYDVYKCIQDNNCLDGDTGSLGHCYCGTLDTATCGAAPFDLSKPGAPNGPCAAIMQKGFAGLTTNAGILGNTTNKHTPFYPSGFAGQRLNCDKSDATCAPICGVQ